jgi:hypothetical protein
MVRNIARVKLKTINSGYKDVTEGRTDGSVTISLRNFVGEGITKHLDQEEMIS